MPAHLSLPFLLEYFHCLKEHMDIQCKGFPQLRNEQAHLYSNVATYQQSIQVKCMFSLCKYIYIHTHSLCIYIYVYKL